ncbi:MAG: hypothetical protein E6Q92_07905 [Burkholderiaceae bacterium]|nr:MAG: hypothetical protein E6Q92_07905 [Burkholderiaceae bacterium]
MEALLDEQDGHGLEEGAGLVLGQAQQVRVHHGELVGAHVQVDWGHQAPAARPHIDAIMQGPAGRERQAAIRSVQAQLAGQRSLVGRVQVVFVTLDALADLHAGQEAPQGRQGSLQQGPVEGF